MPFAKFNPCSPCCCTGLTITKSLNGIRQAGETVSLLDSSGVLAGSCVTDVNGTCSIKVPKNKFYQLTDGTCTNPGPVFVGCKSAVNLSSTARVCGSVGAACTTPGFVADNITITGPEGFSISASNTNTLCSDVFASGEYTVTASKAEYKTESGIITNPCGGKTVFLSMLKERVPVYVYAALSDCHRNASNCGGNQGITISAGDDSVTTNSDGSAPPLMLVPGQLVTYTASRDHFQTVTIGPFPVPICGFGSAEFGDGLGFSLPRLPHLFAFPNQNCFDAIPDTLTVTVTVDGDLTWGCSGMPITCHRTTTIENCFQFAYGYYAEIECTSGPFKIKYDVIIEIAQGICSTSITNPFDVGMIGGVSVSPQLITGSIFPGPGGVIVSAVGTVACPTSFTLVSHGIDFSTGEVRFTSTATVSQ